MDEIISSTNCCEIEGIEKFNCDFINFLAQLWVILLKFAGLNYLKKVEQDEIKKLSKACKLTNIMMNYDLIERHFFTFKIRLPNKNGQQRQLIRQLDTKNSTCP